MANTQPIATILNQQKIVLLDGALATELETHGCVLNDALWSARVLLENPELIYQVHYDYFKVGADVATTASYQATVAGFINRGMTEKEAIDLIKQTVILAKQARDDFWQVNESQRPKPFVAASIGPYGAFLADGSEYVGNYGVSDEQLVDFHRQRMQVLVEAGADMFAFETIPSFQEARVLSELVKEFPTMTAWLSFSIKNATEISDGTSLTKCAMAFEANEQISAIGVNCAPTTSVTQAIQVLHGVTQKPIIVYPNSGETYHPETKTWDGCETGESFDQLSVEWVRAGAKIIGGCCRTTPQDILALANKWRN